MEKSTYISESILRKRIRRFKSIKRGYYSFIILVTLYIFSICAPLFINSNAILIKYANNQYDLGENYFDLNQNQVWDEGEQFNDESQYYFPLFRDLASYFLSTNIPYEANFFGQDEVKGKKKYGKPNYRILQKSYRNEAKGNYVIMPLYPYDPYEEVLSEMDEDFTDSNNNGRFDEGENYIDSNNNNQFDEYRPATYPDRNHFLGTDNQGRDVLSRLIYGFRISITFALVVASLSYILGIIIGGILGYFGGRIDLFGVRIIEVYSSLPFLFILMILASFIKPTVYVLATMYVFISGWIGISFYIRGEFFREKAKDYVSAAVSMGQSNFKVMFKHILPNALTPVVTFAPFAIIGYISALVGLDFLGFGLQPPTPSWGELINQGKENLQYWHLIVSPLFCIGGTLFLITFIGEAVREAFDPKVFSRLR